MFREMKNHLLAKTSYRQCPYIAQPKALPTRMLHYYFTMLVSGIAATALNYSTAFPADTNDADILITSKKLAALKSRNAAPRIANPRQRPAFDVTFQWSEQRRVWDVIRDLVQSPKEAWGGLYENIDNPEYCITVESGSGSFSNWTVGDACCLIISRTLSEAYFRELNPITRELYAEFRRPAFARDPRVLKEWLRAHSDNTLAELQAKACEAAIKQLSSRNDKNRDTFIAAIRVTVKRLRNGDAPIRYPGFGVDEIHPCYSDDTRDDPFADGKASECQ